MNTAESVQTTKPQSTSKSALVVQRKCACGGSSGFSGECEECRTNRLVGKRLQPKFRLTKPGDEYEQEADRVADRVMRMPDAQLPSDAPGSGAAPLVQRRVAGSSEGIVTAPPIVHDVLSSPGRPLDPAARAFFEPRFGHDFSRVRVHTGAKAAASAAAIDAVAYTVGDQLVLGAQGYSRELLAHELTHSVQQGSSSPVVQRQTLWESVQSGFGSLTTSIGSVTEAIGIDPSSVLGEAGTPMSGLRLLKRLRNVPGIGDSLFQELHLSRKLAKLLDLDNEQIRMMDEALADPERFVDESLKKLEPYAQKVEAEARKQAQKLVDNNSRVLSALGKQLSQFPSQWRPMLKDLILSQFSLTYNWDQLWKNLEQIYRDNESGKYDDVYEYWLHVAQALLDALDGVMAVIEMALLVVGLVSGAITGAIALGTAAGVGGGVVSAGTAAAPSAVAGAGTGGAAGGGAGGGLGAVAYEVLGFISIGKSIGLEAAYIADAYKDLIFRKQTAEQEEDDYQQIASSLIALGTMLAFALLGSLAARFAKRVKDHFLAAAKETLAGTSIAALIPEPEVGKPRASEPADKTPPPAVEKTTPERLPDIAPETTVTASPLEPTSLVSAKPTTIGPSPLSPAVGVDLEASVSRSSHQPNTALTKIDSVNEAAYIDAHPEVIEGTPPNRKAKIGDHEIVETAGGCLRKSEAAPINVPCAVRLKPGESAIPEELSLETTALATTSPEGIARTFLTGSSSGQPRWEFFAEDADYGIGILRSGDNYVGIHPDFPDTLFIPQGNRPPKVFFRNANGVIVEVPWPFKTRLAEAPELGAAAAGITRQQFPAIEQRPTVAEPKVEPTPDSAPAASGVEKESSDLSESEAQPQRPVGAQPAWVALLTERFLNRRDLANSLGAMLGRNSSLPTALERLHAGLGDQRFGAVVEYFAGQRVQRRQDFLQLITDLDISDSQLKEIADDSIGKRTQAVEGTGDQFTKGVYEYLADRAVESQEKMDAIRDALNKLDSSHRLSAQRRIDKRMPETFGPGVPARTHSIPIRSLPTEVQTQLNKALAHRTAEQAQYQAMNAARASEAELREQVSLTGLVSEEMGNLGAQEAIRNLFPDAVRAYYASVGSGVFDQLWFVKDKGKTIWIILEAKGAGGKESARKVGGRWYEQGTLEHTTSTVESMRTKAKKDPSLKVWVSQLEKLLVPGSTSTDELVFIKVTTGVIQSGGSPALQELRVQEWDLYPPKP